MPIISTAGSCYIIPQNLLTFINPPPAGGGGAAPTLTSATPGFYAQGDTSRNVSLIGTGFVTIDCNAIFSNPGITVNSSVVNTPLSITANITIAGGATPGLGTVLVRSTLNGDSATQPFTVVSSTVPVTSGLVCQLTATAGTSTTTPTASLASWTDQSGTGTVYAQAVGASQPTYQTNVYNGRPTIRFDGTNDSLSAPGVVSALNTTNNTIFIVAKRTAGTANGTVFANFNLTTAGFFMDLDSGGTNMELDYGTGSGIGFATDPSAAGTAIHQWTGVLDTAGTNKQVIRRDGTQVGTANTAYAAQSTIAPSVGAIVAAAVGFWNGDICEILVYNAALSGANISAVELYLKTKWGTP